MSLLSISERRRIDLAQTNRKFYEALWHDARLIAPERFNTWPIVAALMARAPRRLEIAPGLRPRLPLHGTQFIDVSTAALTCLRRHGASTARALASALPFASGAFDMVCAFDIVEHIDDDDGALAEFSRVAVPGATLLLSAPLHPSHWTVFDELVGHRRRYEPQHLLSKLAKYGFVVEQSAVFGLRPSSSRLTNLGMWWLAYDRDRAMWWYNRVLMPLALCFQKPLKFESGMIDAVEVDEVLLMCHKR